MLWGFGEFVEVFLCVNTKNVFGKKMCSQFVGYNMHQLKLVNHVTQILHYSHYDFCLLDLEIFEPYPWPEICSFFLGFYQCLPYTFRNWIKNHRNYVFFM